MDFPVSFDNLITVGGNSPSSVASHLLRILPTNHPSARLSEYALHKEIHTGGIPVWNSALTAACRILAYDLSKNTNSLDALFPEALQIINQSLRHSATPAYVRWLSGTEITAYARPSQKDSTSDLIVKVPHTAIGPHAYTRALKKQAFLDIMQQQMDPTALRLEPLVIRPFFWTQSHVPGLTFHEIIRDPQKHDVALARWDEVRKKLNGEIWNACWEACAPILELVPDPAFRPQAIGKRFPDYDPKNFVLRDSKIEDSIAEFYTRPIIMIDW